MLINITPHWKKHTIFETSNIKIKLDYQPNQFFVTNILVLRNCILRRSAWDSLFPLTKSVFRSSSVFRFCCCFNLSRSFLDCAFDASKGSGFIRIIYRKMLSTIPKRVKSHIMMMSSCFKISFNEAAKNNFTFLAVSAFNLEYSLKFFLKTSNSDSDQISYLCFSMSKIITTVQYICHLLLM